MMELFLQKALSWIRVRGLNHLQNQVTQIKKLIFVVY